MPPISRTEAIIINRLIVAPRSTSLDIVEASEGQVKRGGVYVLLSRLIDKECIEYDTNEEGRRLYKATGLGERAFRSFLRGFELKGFKALGGLV